MKELKIDLKKITKKYPYTPFAQRGLSMIADFFKRGKIVVYPTDTIYGIGCLATDKKAIQRIYKIKKREKGKSLLILVSSLAMAKKYCFVSRGQDKFLRQTWLNPSQSHVSRSARPRYKWGTCEFYPPSQGEGSFKSPSAPFDKGGIGRPVTVILKSRGILPKELEGEGNGLAVRLPRMDFLIKIIRKAGAPIVSTSANISGREYKGSVEEINKLFGKKIDLIVDGGKLKNKPSRIIDIRNINDIKTIRG